jgi:hypothetical protein
LYNDYIIKMKKLVDVDIDYLGTAPDIGAIEKR